MLTSTTPCKSLSALLFNIALLSTTHLHAEDKVPFPPGTEKITQASVTGTISFLASDELAGRGTASKEFDIASAYVASRFLAAGLKPAGDNGSFYHKTVFPLKFLPATQSVLVSDAENPDSHIPVLGVLGASPTPTSFSGALIQIDPEKSSDIKNLSRFAVAQWETTAKSQRALSQLARTCQHLQAAGAQGLLLRAAPNSEWLKIATELEGLPRTDVSRSLDFPVIIIPLDAELPSSLKIETPGLQIVNHTMRNVIGALTGSDSELSQQAVLYSAHLDHLGTTHAPGDNIYNGADDDASGVTGVITLADAFAAMPTPPKRTLLFMTYWGEESGLLGSQAFVDRPTWPLESITANINIEMIGRPEPGARNKTWVTGWNESDLGPILRENASKFGYEIFEHPKLSPMLYKSSDNWSFAQKGVIAHSFAAGSLHADYHQVDDEWDRLELDHMTEVIRSLFLGSLPLADGSATPKKLR